MNPTERDFNERFGYVSKLFNIFNSERRNEMSNLYVVLRKGFGCSKWFSVDEAIGYIERINDMKLTESLTRRFLSEFSDEVMKGSFNVRNSRSGIYMEYQIKDRSIL